MKIRYKTRKLRFNRIMIFFWIILSLANFVYSDWHFLAPYLLLVLSVASIFLYSFEYINQYLTIKNGTISKNFPFSKKIKLKEITEIKKFAGDFILKTESAKLTINTGIIDKNSLFALTDELKEQTGAI